MNGCIVCGFDSTGYCEFCPSVVTIDVQDVEELADRLSCSVYWRGSVCRQVEKLGYLKEKVT